MKIIVGYIITIYKQYKNKYYIFIEKRKRKLFYVREKY